MKDTIELELSLEHIHPDLIDIPCLVELEIYKGSTEGFTSDDPGELEIFEVMVMKDVYSDDGCVFLQKGGTLVVSNEIEKQIMRYYE